MSVASLCRSLCSEAKRPMLLATPCNFLIPDAIYYCSTVPYSLTSCSCLSYVILSERVPFSVQDIVWSSSRASTTNRTLHGCKLMLSGAARMSMGSTLSQPHILSMVLMGHVGCGNPELKYRCLLGIAGAIFCPCLFSLRHQHRSPVHRYRSC